ncbi:hypothetical protein B1R32_10558 [Abditibacterium utsteinense]|uniref:Uncharacterized protein n=1 Tax=Abditibacterium utsteinense TaxID=1960156 RepID=A0A2S8SU94_9BACT|nr:hypothetical protein [Abditibacterium utsteinense]PQV64377.1 hypothetical protein B1R32_10558 [Abditibacterium utsteinense]
MTEPEFSTPIEKQLREAAPILSTSLKSRTLNRCAVARQKRRDRVQRNWSFAVAGVFALQIFTLSQLDAQNARLIAGRGAAPVFASASLSQVRDSLQERSRQLALWMTPSKLG